MVQRHRYKPQIGFKPHSLPGGAPSANQGCFNRLIRAETGTVSGHWEQITLPGITFHFQTMIGRWLSFDVTQTLKDWLPRNGEKTATCDPVCF